MVPSGPLAAPRRVKANMTDYSSACVKWSPNPSPLVLEYVIQFAPLDASISVITVRVNSTETMVEIDGHLLPITVFSCIRLRYVRTAPGARQSMWPRRRVVGYFDQQLFFW